MLIGCAALGLLHHPVIAGTLPDERPREEAMSPDLRGDWSHFRFPLFQVYEDRFPGQDKLLAEIDDSMSVARLVDLLGWGFDAGNFFKKMRFPDLFVRTPCNFNEVSDKSMGCLTKKGLRPEVWEQYVSVLAGDNYQRIVMMSFLLGRQGDTALNHALAAMRASKSPEKRWVIANSIYWIIRYMNKGVPDRDWILSVLADLYVEEYDPDVRLQLADAMAIVITRRAKPETRSGAVPSAKLFGTDLTAARLVLILDCSGSMTDLLPLVKPEIISFIQSLPDDAQINVALIGPENPTWLSDKMLPLKAGRAKVFAFVRKARVQPGKRTQAAVALKEASSWSPGQVVLVSDGQVELADFLLAPQLDKRAPPIGVSTFLIFYEKPGDALMKRLAESTGGSYTFVPPHYFGR
jgi:hypothetical protein